MNNVRSTQTWIKRVALFILAAAVAGTALTTVNISKAATDGRSCPFNISGGSDSVLIQFPKVTLFSSRKQADAIFGPASANVGAGTWQVSLASYDSHSTKANPYQPYEQWFLRLNYGSGGSVDSSAISDLPDNQDSLSQTVNSGLALTDNVTSVTAVHAFYPNTAINSISPVCVLLERVAEPTPTPSPTPSPSPTPTSTPSPEPEHNSDGGGNDEPAALEIAKTDHTNITRPGHTLNYEITVKNTGQGTITDLIIQDTVPSDEAIEQVSSSPTISGRTITWGGMALGGGETMTFFVTTKVSDKTANGKSLVNVVKAKSEDKGISATAKDTTEVKTQGQISAAQTEQPKAVPITAKTGPGATSALAILTGASGLVASLLRRRIG